MIKTTQGSILVSVIAKSFHTNLNGMKSKSQEVTMAPMKALAEFINIIFQGHTLTPK